MGIVAGLNRPKSQPTRITTTTIYPVPRLAVPNDPLTMISSVQTQVSVGFSRRKESPLGNLRGMMRFTKMVQVLSTLTSTTEEEPKRRGSSMAHRHIRAGVMMVTAVTTASTSTTECLPMVCGRTAP